MKRGVLITLLSALAGGVTAYAVVNNMTSDNMSVADANVEGGCSVR